MSAWVSFVTFFSRRFRLARSALYRRECPDLSRLRVCDLGGSRHFWETMPEDLVPGTLTLLNVADDGQSTSHSGRLGHLEIRLYDGRRIPYPDKFFDVVLCNSVIEHVPLADRGNLAREIQRVGKRFFVQTPAFAFPIEPHFVAPFVHWLPRRLGRKLAPLGLWAILNRPTRAKMDGYFDEVNLLTRRQLTALFPGAAVAHERVLGLSKSYTAYGAA